MATTIPEEDRDGTRQVLVERFVEQRLPLLTELRDRVDAGELLTDGDIEVLSRIIDQAADFGRTAHEFPELKPLLARLIDLYEHITERALHNEESAG